MVDTPIIHYAYEEARAAGCERFIFVTGRNKNAIMNHFDHSYELQTVLSEKNKAVELERTMGWLPDAGSIVFTRQLAPLGLGHAVWCAREWIGDEPFAVILADDMVLSPTPCLKQMVDAYTSGTMLGVMDVSREQTVNYGIIDIDHTSTPADARLTKAKGLVEKPAPENAPSTLSVIGRYILTPEIFGALETTKPGAGGEIQLTDAINQMVNTQDVHGFRFAGTRFDCGHLSGFIEANVAYALQRPEVKADLLPKLKGLVG